MAELGLSDSGRDNHQLLRSLRRLAAPGACRERTITARGAEFRAGAISALVNPGLRDARRDMGRAS